MMQAIAYFITGLIVWPVVRSVAEEVAYSRSLRRYKRGLPRAPKAFFHNQKKTVK